MSDVALWKEKAQRAGEQIAALIREDARQWVERTLREAFVASDETDALSDADVARLKADVRSHAEATARSVADGLDATRWAAVGEAADLEALPTVADAIARIATAPAAMASDWPALARPEWPAYALPRRFIAGQDLVTLGRALFKANAQLATLRAAEAAAQVRRSAADRARRWDDA